MPLYNTPEAYVFPWEDWYLSQEFFSIQRYEKIKDWMKPEKPANLYMYRQRRNNAS